MSFIYAKLLVVVCIAFQISEVVTHNVPLHYYEVSFVVADYFAHWINKIAIFLLCNFQAVKFELSVEFIFCKIVAFKFPKHF